MQFNVQFDITALFFLSIIMIKFFSQRQFPLLSTKFYGTVLVAAAITLFFTITGSLSLEFTEILPIQVCYAVNFLYFLSLLALPPAIFLYILALIAPEVRLKPVVLLRFSIPAFVSEIAVIAAFAMGKLFTILPDGTYVRGPLTRLTYIETALYVVMSLAALFVYRKYLSSEIRKSFTGLTSLVVFCCIVQYIIPQYSTISLGIVAALLIVFFTLESPESMTDSVTGLNNYKAFELILRTRYLIGDKFKIVVTEIHGLRKVNTIYGIKAGDKILKDIADYLEPNKDTWVFRIAPTRFAMLAVKPEAYNKYLSKVTERGNYAWPVSRNAAAQMVFKTCHIEHSDIIESTEDLLNIIDRAMEEQEHREEPGTYELDRDVVARIDRRTKLHMSITKSLETGLYFKLFYQPIYNCREDRFTSAEALLRYDHPDFGLVSPGEFLPIINDAGLHLALDKLVVGLAIDDIKKGILQSLGFDRVNINLTSATILQADYILGLIEKIKAEGIDSGFIAFEITESMAVNSSKDLKDRMSVLKDLGIRFAVDDFGTGYSNLTSLVDLPFDILKFDKSLFNLGSSYGEVVQLMKKLCSTTVSEGVETAEQAELVKSLGVTYIQGFYYAKPMALNSLKEFIQSREYR